MKITNITTEEYQWPRHKPISNGLHTYTRYCQGNKSTGCAILRRMKEQASAPSYKRHRFPPAIIGHAVWLYFRFALSYRDVEELLAERGVIVTYETIRQWSQKFGQTYANALRRRRPRSGDKWHLDGVIASPPFGVLSRRRGWHSGSPPPAARPARDR